MKVRQMIDGGVNSQRTRESVAIAVLTRNRTRQLTACVASLQRAKVPQDLDVSVLIIDNNDAGCEVDQVALQGISSAKNLSFKREVRRGVGPARASAIRAAEVFDWLLFFDDDQVAAPSMLVELFAVQRRSRADLVTGVVLPTFSEGQSSKWLRFFFHRERFVSGTSLPAAGAGCLLIRHAALDADTIRILDTHAGGGEDTALTMRLTSLGYRCVWADEALAYEAVDEQRMTLAWVLARSMRHGRTLAELERGSSRCGRARLAAAGLGRLILGLASLLKAFGDAAAAARGIARMARGIGYLRAAWSRPPDAGKRSKVGRAS